MAENAFNFDADTEDFESSGGIQGPQSEYIGPMHVVKYDLEPLNEEYDEVINIYLELDDGPEQGEIYRWIQFAPNTQDKATNIFKRYGHFFSHLLPFNPDEETREEKRKKVRKFLKANNFEELQENVIALLDKLKDAGKLDKTLIGKLVPGRKQDGKPRYPAFTNYVGFVADEHSENPPTFSRQERQEIKEYEAALSASPDEVEGADGETEEVPEDSEFDF